MIDLEKMRERHCQIQDFSVVAGRRHDIAYCQRCKLDWPCDAIQLADEIERLREALEKIEKECHARLSKRCGYDEAIHAIADDALSPADSSPTDEEE